MAKPLQAAHIVASRATATSVSATAISFAASYRRFSTVGANASAPTGCSARNRCSADCLANLRSTAVENQADSQNEPNRGGHPMTSFRQIAAIRGGDPLNHE